MPTFFIGSRLLAFIRFFAHGETRLLWHNARHLSLREAPKRETSPSGRFARYYTMPNADTQVNF
jgi:hypothetical protein